MRIIIIGFNYLEVKANLVTLELNQRNCKQWKSLCSPVCHTALV